MENRTINLFYITIEEEKCEPPGFAKREPLLKKWVKRRQDRKQGKTGLPVYEVLRQFPYPGGGIRLCYCILPRTFLKEAENAKKMAKWFLCMDEAIKNAEENLQDERFTYFLANSQVINFFPFAENIPPELFEMCLWDAKRQIKDAKVSISLSEDCSSLVAEQMIGLLNPYLPRLNEVAFVGEENSASKFLEDYLYEEYGMVMNYQKYPLKDTVWVDLTEKVSPVVSKYAKENEIYHINEARVRKFLDTAVKNGYNNKVN